MEYVIISGGVPADQSDGVAIIDLDSLEDSLTDVADFAAAYAALVAVAPHGAWARKELDRLWAERDDAARCPRCSSWVVSDGDAAIDIAGGRACVAGGDHGVPA